MVDNVVPFYRHWGLEKMSDLSEVTQSMSVQVQTWTQDSLKVDVCCWQFFLRASWCFPEWWKMGHQMGMRSYVPPNFSSWRFSRKWVMSWMDAPFLLSDWPCFFEVARVRPSPSTSTCTHVALSLWDSSDPVPRARHCALYPMPFLKTMFSLFFEPWTVNYVLRYWYPIFSWFYVMCIWLLWLSIFKVLIEIKSHVCSVFPNVCHRLRNKPVLPKLGVIADFFLSFIHTYKPFQSPISSTPKLFPESSQAAPQAMPRDTSFLLRGPWQLPLCPFPFPSCVPVIHSPCGSWSGLLNCPSDWVTLVFQSLRWWPVALYTCWYSVRSLSTACKAQRDLALLNLPPHLLGLSLLWTTSPTDFVLSLKEITRS